MAHRSARLTVGGRLLLMNGSWCKAGRWPRRPPRKGSAGRRPTSGGPAGGRTAPPGCWTAAVRRRRAPGPGAGGSWKPSSACGAATAGARTDCLGTGAAPLDGLRRAAPPGAQPPHGPGPHHAAPDPLCARPPGRAGAPGYQTAGGIPPGGGKRLDPRWPATKAGYQSPAGRGLGFEYVHVAVDDASRWAYVEVLPDERAATAAAFLTHVVAAFGAQGIPVQRVLTDNGSCYRAHAFAQTARQLGVRPKRTRPYGPRPTAKPKPSSAPCCANGPTCGQQRGAPHRPPALAPCLQSLSSPLRA